MQQTTNDRRYSATPAGICEAARAGDVTSIDLILAERPKLLTIDNPHNWTRTVDGHEVRGAYNKKPVEVAAFFNQPQAVAKLLEISRDSEAIKGPFSDFLPFDGHFNSLSIAIAIGHAEVIKAIEADIFARLYVDPELLNYSEDDGRTVLHYAAEQGHMPLVRALLKRGAIADPQQKSGPRVIHAVLDDAIDDEHREVARLLIEHGAECDLWVATALDDVDRVKELLAEDRSRTTKYYRPDRTGYSEGFPLVRACANGNREIVELLLDHGADVNADLGVEDPPEFGMPIVAAVYAKHFDIANVLLDRGASVHAHPNCAAPLVDMLYYATDEASRGWLALGELKYATEDPRSHLQPDNGGSPQAVELYERVLSLGGKPQMYSIVKNRNHREIERLLREEPEAIATNPGGQDTIFNCLSSAAAWLGDVSTMELCLALQPNLHSPDAANACITAAIRSHNRDGSFVDYRRIIEMNLQYLKDHNAALTVESLSLLAEDFLENYSYGTHADLPKMDDLLDLAGLFLDYDVDIDQRQKKTGRTALAQAVNEGHAEYVEFLLEHGVDIHNDDPPQTNPVLLARKQGFTKILELLGETPGRWGEVVRSDMIEMEPPTASEPPHLMTPLNNAIIRLGIATIDAEFQPKGDIADTHTKFIEFPGPFPDQQFDNVRLIITNRNNPQIVGSATTGVMNGKQGFLLKARNCWPPSGSPDGGSSVVKGVSFSWMAILPTDQLQQNRFAVRYGLIPFREYREFPGQPSFTFPDTAELYASEPLEGKTGDKFVFLTTTVSGSANAAAADADQRGIAAITAHQTGHKDGGSRLHWMVIAEQTSEHKSPASAPRYFDSDQLWIQTSRAEPSFQPGWRDYFVDFLRPLRERSPCVFVTSNRHGVEGHHSSVVAMSWACRREHFVIKSRSFDPLLGQSNFDYFAIGHCDVSADEIAEANRSGPPAVDPWDRYNDWNASELAASGRIGVNEFGNHGGSLLHHCAYERFQIADARKLLALGADVDQKQPVTQLTALHIAAAYGRLKMAHLLIERGADVNAKTVAGTEWTFPPRWQLKEEDNPPYKGETPLHFAMLYRKYAIARMLLDSGADPNAEDCHGDRPIDYLPEWSVYPDNLVHWRLINHRSTATKRDYEEIIKWILAEDARYSN